MTRKWRAIITGPWGRRQKTISAGTETMALIHLKLYPGERLRSWVEITKDTTRREP